VADQVDFSSRLSQGLLYGVVQVALNEQIGTFRVDADAGKVWPISDARQPAMKLVEIEIVPRNPGMITTPEPSPRGTPNP